MLKQLARAAVVIGFGILPVAYAQIPPAQQIRAVIPKTAVSAPTDRRFLVVLTETSPTKNWCVGVIPESGDQIELAMAVVTQTEGAGHIAGIEPVPPANIQVLPGELRIRNIGAFSGNLLVFVKAPQDITVSVVADGLPQLLGKVGDGLAVRNGFALGEKPRSFSNLLRLLASSNEKPSPQKLPSGEYLVPAEFVRSNIRRIVVPEYVGPAGAIASVRVTIDENGSVSRVQRLRGDSGFLETIDQAAHQWSFRPLTVDGKPVVVICHVVFSLRNGRVISTLTE